MVSQNEIVFKEGNTKMNVVINEMGYIEMIEIYNDGKLVLSIKDDGLKTVYIDNVKNIEITKKYTQSDETPWFVDYSELKKAIEQEGLRKVIEEIVDYISTVINQGE